MAEAGGLQALYEQYRNDGFMMITALDGDDPDKLMDWAEEYGLTHPVVGDAGGAFYSLYGTGFWPMPVVIDRGMVLTSVNDPATYHQDVVDLMKGK